MPRIYHLLDFAKPQGLVYTSKSSGRRRGKPLPSIRTKGVLSNRPAWERENTILEISDDYSEDDDLFEVIAFGRKGKGGVFPAPLGAEATLAHDMGRGNSTGHVSLPSESTQVGTQLGRPTMLPNPAPRLPILQPLMNGSAHFLDDTYGGPFILPTVQPEARLASRSQNYCPSDGSPMELRAAVQEPGPRNKTYPRLGAFEPDKQSNPMPTPVTEPPNVETTQVYDFDEEIDHFVATQAANLEPNPNDYPWLQDFEAFDPTAFSNPAPSNAIQMTHEQQQHLSTPITPICQCQAYTNNNASFGANISLPDHALQKGKEIFPRVSNLPNRYFTTGICDAIPRVDIWGRPYKLVCKILVEHCYDAAKKESFEVVWMQGEWTTSLVTATQSLANMILAVTGVWKGRIPVLPDKLFGDCSVCARQRSPEWVI